MQGETITMRKFEITIPDSDDKEASRAAYRKATRELEVALFGEAKQAPARLHKLYPSTFRAILPNREGGSTIVFSDGLIVETILTPSELLCC